MDKQSQQCAHPAIERQKLSRVISLILLGLSTVLSLNTSPAMADQAISAEMQQQHTFDIAAQPLGDALIAFAQQSDLQISAAPYLLARRHGNQIKGQMSSEQALQRILKGSDIGWRYERQLLTFHKIAGESDVLQLSDSVVMGKSDSAYQGEAIIDRRAIENFAGANGDMTTLLKLHPSVRFDTTQQSSNTPGEITPADISINGAKFYQNNFMIDGVSINNDLDPGASSGSRSDYNGTYLLPSNAFGIALDADLIEEVLVYDSNVSAKYGRFNGGVVNAITRRPREGFHGKLSAQMTKSDWTSYHINGDDISEEAFEQSSTFSNQPEFKKLSTRAMLEGMVTENFGLIGNFVRKTSEIPLYAYSDGFQSQADRSKHTQERVIENQMLKAFWTPHDRLDLQLTLIDAPAYGTYFKADQKNSGFQIDQGGQSAALKATWTGDRLTYNHQFAYKTVQTSRDAESNIHKTWRWSQEKNWGNPYRDGALSTRTTSTEGGMGDIEQRQTSFEYSLDIQASAFEMYGTRHSLNFGAEVRRQEAIWEVMEDSISAGLLGLTNASGGTSCVTASGALDNDYCSISIGATGIAQRQFFRQLAYVKAGKIEVQQTDYALYLEDEIQIGRLKLRPGLRLDGDDYMDKKTLAPRFAASYDFFGDQSSVLTAGANRYYGRNLFKYRLADGRQSLWSRATRGTSNGDTITDFADPVAYGVDESSFRKLDMPYDDELMLGFSQRMLGLTFDLKYVKREGRDQVVRSRANYLGLEQGNGTDHISNYYTYTNAGKSSSETVTLSISPLRPLELGGTATSFMLAIDWSQTESAYSDYDSLFNQDKLDDQDVYFDGKLMPYSELPANNFNRPWTIRLNAVTSIPSLNLTWTNFLRYRGPYEQIYRGNPSTITLNGDVYENYQVGEVQAAPTWDTRIKWTLPLGGTQSTYVAVDITNVTDKVNNLVSDTGTIRYETGRQYWLEVGYQF